MWGSRCNIQLHSRSGTNDLKGKARNEWEAIALCALLTDRVSKYVKDAVSSYAIRDWQWLARLVEKLTHRGLLCYMVYIIATTAGLIIHATSFAEISWKPLARKNNINHLIIFGASMDTAGSMICDNNSISLKTVDIDSTIRYSIQSSRGRISTTYHTSNDVPIDALPHITDESSLEPSSQTKYSHLSAVNANYSHLSAINDATTSSKEGERRNVHVKFLCMCAFSDQDQMCMLGLKQPTKLPLPHAQKLYCPFNMHRKNHNMHKKKIYNFVHAHSLPQQMRSW